ncbi:MAG: hypothetical protein ACK4F9_07980, partial [Brevinematia bacterium]
MKMTYVVASEGTNYFFANESAFVVDKGINKGIILGFSLRTAPVSPSDLEGIYVVLGLNQSREPGETNFTSKVMKGYIKLSNTGSYLDIYIGTNINSLQKENNAFQLHQISSVDGKIPPTYFLATTNNP